MLEQTDGLLRGSREERIAQILSLRRAEWSLGTVLDLHCGLLDHAEDVRRAAIEALKGIARKLPEPIALTPLGLLAPYIFSFTVASGEVSRNFEFLVELNTPESLQLAESALERVGRNEDFKAFVEIVVRANKLELLQALQKAELSKTKAKILRDALERA